MTLDFTAVNWVAVIAATIAGVVIGFVWYLPQVFGRRWAAAVGRDLPGPGDLSPTVYLAGIIQAFVVAYVLALFIIAAAGLTLVGGLIVALLAWFGFVAASSLSAMLYEGKSLEYWMINAGFALVSMLVMGAIIGLLGA